MEAVSRHVETAGSGTPSSRPEDYTSLSGLAPVLDASPDIQVLLSSDQTILFANAAFHATNPDEAGPLVGQSLASSLMGRDARRAASRRIILDTVRQALAAGTVIQPPPFRYDIQKDLSRPPREAWWRLSAAPCDLDGRPCLLLTVTEVTAAILAGRSGVDVAANETDRNEALLWAERRRLSQMFDQATDMMSLVVGPDHVFELVNPALARVGGDVQLLGRSVRDIVQSDRGREILRRMDEVRATGRPFVAHAQPFRIDEAGEDHFLDLTLQPLTNEAGQVEAIFCRGRDVTEQVRALEVQRFLREELAHRQGNILAVVLALAEQSAAHAASLDSFRRAFAGRLSAIAAANALLSRNGLDARLGDILTAVAPPSNLSRMGGGGAAAAPSPKAVVTLGLMFHELLQASRAGTALSSTGSRIRAHKRAGSLLLIWTSPGLLDFGEDGDDFARRLIDHAVRHEFNGRWALFRRKRGTAACFEFPLGHSAWVRPGAVA